MNQISPLSEITIQDILLYSPYDNRYRLKNKLSLTDFRELRIIPTLYEDEKENLKRIIDPEGNFFQSFYILSGYSGNGKTTFLNWFKEQIEPENFKFEIIDLIDEGRGTKNDFSLLEECIREKIIHELTNKKILGLVAKHPEIFMRYFSREQLNSLINAFQELNIDEVSIHYLLIEYNFSQLLILFLLNNIINFLEDDNLNNCKSFTFCFDNLDELKFEYLTPRMWSEILDVSSKMTRIIQDLNWDFNFSKRIVFVLVFREANIACGTAQLAERISAIKTYKRFIYTNIGREIIERRLLKSAKYLNEEDIRLRAILSILHKEKFTDEVLLPLFNYDYRKLLEATIAVIRPETSGGKQYRLLSLLDEEYNSIPGLYSFGKRGILFNSYIRYFAINNFLSKLAPPREINKNTSHCNKVRLILTIFSNLSFPNGFPIDKKELAEIKPNSFSLIQAYDACSEIVTINDFFKKINTLIDLNKSSWAHLITIYGKQPVRDGETYWFDFSKEAALLKKFFDNEELTIDEDNYIQGISISLNASAYIYLRHLLTHFEYISAYKSKIYGELWYSYKPLFQLTDIIIDGTPKWEFQVKMNNVFMIVESYSSNTGNFFESTFINNLGYNKENYISSNYVFKGENKEKNNQNDFPRYALYMSRLITTHIEYIETFRHYITNEGFKIIERKIAESNASLMQNLYLNSSDRINVFIFDSIDKYIKLLDSIKDPSMTSVVKGLQSSLDSARQDHRIWIQVQNLAHNKRFG